MKPFNFNEIPLKIANINTKHRKINTDIPAPGTKELISELKKYESRSMHGQLPIIWDKAEGFSIYDIAGNKWIDFTSTIFVTNTGHANSTVISAVKKMLDKKLIHTYVYVNKVRIEYIKKLIEITPVQLEKIFLLSAGTETTDAAVKLMRLKGLQENIKKKGIISIEGNFHGRTMGAQLLSNNDNLKKWIPCKDSKNYYFPFPYEWKLENGNGKKFFEKSVNALIKNNINPKTDICGIMLETYQGWGACFYPQDYIDELKKFCNKNNILICFDEMQSGFGRTGKLFGFEHYNIDPDLICIGKGMGSGFPVSGVLGRSDIMDLPEVGEMSSTHSANPIVCAAGLATIEEIYNKNLIDKSKTLGLILIERLKTIMKNNSDKVSYVFGKGLVAAMHFHKEGNPDSFFPSKVVESCMKKGLLVVHTGRESIKIAPPLMISKEALEEGLDVLKEAIEEVKKSDQS